MTLPQFTTIEAMAEAAALASLPWHSAAEETSATRATTRRAPEDIPVTARQALFSIEGGAFVPAAATAGPWHPQLLHGGAVAALLATVMESHSDDAFDSMRLTVDLVRPVPMAPITVAVREIRKGRKLHLFEAEAVVAGDLVARASLLRLRRGDNAIEPRSSEPAGNSLGRPGRYVRFDGQPRRLYHEQFVGDGVEMRLPRAGSFVGQRSGWLRLLRPVLPGQRPSPMAVAAAVADNANGLGALVSFEESLRISYLNADLDIHLARPVRGEWVRLDTSSRWLPAGTGLTQARLSDLEGPVGVCQQALAIDLRQAV